MNSVATTLADQVVEQLSCLTSKRVNQLKPFVDFVRDHHDSWESIASCIAVARQADFTSGRRTLDQCGTSLEFLAQSAHDRHAEFTLIVDRNCSRMRKVVSPRSSHCGCLWKGQRWRSCGP